jgi:hypothetical protein
MANLVSLSDFVAPYALGVGTDANAQKVPLAVIAEWEPKFLGMILGFDLKNKFYLSTYGGGVIPPTPEMEAIWKKIEQDDPCRLESDGLKVTLCKLLYLKIVQAQSRVNTVSGNRKAETQTTIASSNTEVYVIWNSGVTSARNIQQYCLNDTEKYPTFKGICLEYTSFI